jgi:hypothetical protein
MKTLRKITRPHLILCEGADAKYFLVQYLLQTLGDMQEYFFVADFGGITELAQGGLHILPSLPGFEALRSITVIRDAENDAKNASRSICSSFEANGYAVPANPCEIAVPANGQHHVKVAYALFPLFGSINEDGTLEDLCLKVLAHTERDKIKSIANDAVFTAENKFGRFKRRHKNYLHTYLSLIDEFVGLKIGESAQAGAFDFNNEHFESLKFLLERIRV